MNSESYRRVYKYLRGPMNYDRQLTRFTCGVVAFIFAMLAIAIGIVWGWPKP